jgi:hypothetical protein
MKHTSSAWSPRQGQSLYVCKAYMLAAMPLLPCCCRGELQYGCAAGPTCVLPAAAARCLLLLSFPHLPASRKEQHNKKQH